MKASTYIYRSILSLSLILCLCGCTSGSGSVNVPSGTSASLSVSNSEVSPSNLPSESNIVSESETEVALSPMPSSSIDDSSSELSSTGLWDNTPCVLIPLASGINTAGNQSVNIDYSNASEGYIVAAYLGSNQKVKFRITGPDAVTYTYDMHGGIEVFPLTAGSGSYEMTLYENIEGTSYSTAFSESIQVDIINTFGPFLYPNQYVNFGPNDQTVSKASDLALGANNEIDVVASIYSFVTTNIKYDYPFADTVQSGYLPTPDNTLATKKGICFDYAALMCAMLRSQRIPARLEIGYAGDAYHAWLSVYTKDKGWINGIIVFDGNKWVMMDPTFTANAGEKETQKFIGDGSNYSTLYIY